MYTKLEDLPQPSADDLEIRAEPCICSCKALAVEGKEDGMAGDMAAVDIVVHYDINGALPTGNN